MKTTKFFILVVTIVVVNTANAQFDTSYVMPQHPGPSDIVSLIYSCTILSTPCSLYFFDINITGFQIVVNAIYKRGIVHALCFQTDTLNIGILNLGNYELILNIQGQYFPDTFLIDTLPYRSDTLYFTVDTLSGFLNENFSELTLNIYPNPAHGEIYLEYPKDFLIAKIKLYAITGRLIKIFSKEEKQLNISGLPPGLYILYIEANDQIFREKIIIDN